MLSNVSVCSGRSLRERVRMPALVLLACLLEVGALAIAPYADLLAAGLLHVAASIALGTLVHAELPERGASARSAAIGATVLVAFLPGLGLLGVLAVALPSWTARDERPAPTLHEAPLPTFSAEALATLAASPVQTPFLEDALAPTHEPAQRLEAVASLRQMEATRAVPLLRAALADASEDVRLLAHASLERRERLLRTQLEASLARLRSIAAEDGPDTHAVRARAHVELASHYWELVYGGFVSAELTRPTLEKAAYHALEGAELASDGPTALIAVRAYLTLGELDAAESALGLAASQGVARTTLAPLRAELAFLAGRMDAVDGALGALSALAARKPDLGDAVRFWAARSRS